MTSSGSEQPCIQLSVVIPAYNEEQRLPEYLASVRSYLVDTFGSGAEIIVVDDGSSDATAEAAMNADNGSGMVRVIRLEQNGGKGHAVKVGMLAASGRLRLFTDADGATPIAEFARLLAAIDGGADIAVASRALRDDSRVVASKLSRKIIGTCFNVMVRTLAVPGIRDTQCGFKLFKGAVAERLFTAQCIPGFGFDPEVLFLAHMLKYRVAEVPVNWKDVPGSKVSVFNDSVRMFFDLLRIRMYWSIGAYRN